METAHGQFPAERTDQIALGHLLASCSLFAYRLAQHERAEAMLVRSMEILSPLNEPRLLVQPITYLGVVMNLMGNYSRATDLFNEGLEKAKAAGDRWFAVMCLSQQVNVALMTGRRENTHDQMQAAVAEWRAIGDPRFIAFGLNLLSQSALVLGRYNEALAALEESVSLNSMVGARWNLGYAYLDLGLIAQAQGEHSQAVDMFRKCVDTFAELGGRQYVAQGLAEMGRSVIALGNDTEAERVWRESLCIASEIHGVPVALEALVGLASLQTKRGDLEQALELLLIVLDHPASVQETRSRATHLRAELEVDLTPQQIESIQTKAGKKTLESIAKELLR